MRAKREQTLKKSALNTPANCNVEERQRRVLDLGVRAFALVSLLDLLATLESPPFAWIGMDCGDRSGDPDECGQPSAAPRTGAHHFGLMVTFTLGVLVGEGVSSLPPRRRFSSEASLNN